MMQYLETKTYEIVSKDSTSATGYSTPEIDVRGRAASML